MYAVVSSGGKQYRVEAGSTLTIERLEVEPGASVTFDRVLMIADGDDVTVGTPVVPGASVSATVLGETLGPKLVIFKFKQKVKYRRRTGHRQHLMSVHIDAIHPTLQTAAAAAATEPEAKPKAAVKPKTPEPVEEKAAAPKAARPRTPRAKAGTPDVAATEQPKPRARRAAKPKGEE